MTEQPTHVINNRYRIEDQIGRGGMGAVYRVYDRLTGQTVALKQVTTPSDQLDFASRVSADSSDLRLALANEFKTLASLRHPHIISVLDYGFDRKRQPYFTMDLLTASRTILEASRQQSFEEQIRLLVQLLQALVYLHQRGIIHRDLKPGNVLVEGEQVKVLDFGLSQIKEHSANKITETTAGTFAYMAPEMFDGISANKSTDLYAVGVIAYEVLAGHHPFNASKLGTLVNEILNKPADVQSVGVNPETRVVLQRLLAKTHEERFGSASEVIAALCAAAQQAIPPETVDIRESFLQAAPLVGRETEVAQLSQVLAQALNGKGSAWLIGGESGIGKSRLLDELRTLALVQGALVLRGQAIAEGGAPYLLWREALRYLCMQTELSDREATVLKALVLDIGNLLGHDVPDAPEINPQSAQLRLLTTIEDLFRRQTKPLVLLLEDLQWSSESLTVLKRLTSIVEELPLLIVGNYRDDERPDLPGELPDMQLMTLARLDGVAIADLSAAMLGTNGRQPQVVALLERETEGNIFFIVEVVRALAEEAGELDHIGATTLPQKIFAGGIQAVIQRRLSRVPSNMRPLLQTAAVAGRELDEAVLRTIAPDTNFESWLTACADASILAVQDGRWRFAHDKLREELLINLAEDHRQTLHRHVADAMETIYADRLSEFHSLIGEHFLQSEMWEQAADHLIQAGDAAARLNALVECRLYYAGSIEALKHVPDTEHNRRRRVDILVKQASVSWGANDPAYHLAQLGEAELVMKELTNLDGAPSSDHLLLAHVHYWMGRMHSMRNEIPKAIGYYRQVLSLAQETGDEELLAIPASMIGRALSFQGQFGNAALLLAQALGPLEKSASWADWVITVELLGVCLAVGGKVAIGLAKVQNGLTRAMDIKYPLGIIMSHFYLSIIYYYSGELKRAVDATQTMVEMAQQSGEQIYVYLGYGFQAWFESRLSHHENAFISMAHSKTVARILGGQLLAGQWFAAFEAEMTLNTGRIEESLALAKVTVANTSPTGDIFAEGIAERVWGQALAALQPAQWDDAETHLAASVQLLKSGETRLETARTHIAWGEVCRDRGNIIAAREHFEKAASQFEASELPGELDKVKVLINQLG